MTRITKFKIMRGERVDPTKVNWDTDPPFVRGEPIPPREEQEHKSYVDKMLANARPLFDKVWGVRD